VGAVSNFRPKHSVEITHLADVFVIFALAIVVVLLCQRVRIPSLVGFLVTGALAGPAGLGLVQATADVEQLAEIGIILLLFTVGIEFSLRDLLQIRKLVLIGGSLQVTLTVVATYALARWIGQPPPRALFFGFLVSLSSTAIVLRILQDRSETGAPHGRAVLGILIFQDIIIVPMMLVTPILASGGGMPIGDLLVLLLKGALIVGVVIVAARWLVPLLLLHIARSRSDELFSLSIAVICFGVAWLTHSLGLSLALGAFLAGLIISESEYSHRALGNVLPFRDVFTSLFFVSTGMLLDVDMILQHPAAVFSAVMVVMLLKTLLGAVTAAILGFPFRIAMLIGLAIGQVGEFAFVLASSGVDHGLLDQTQYKILLVVCLLSMAASPFLLGASQRITDLTDRLPLPKRIVAGAGFSYPPPREPMQDHVIIIGYGVIGRTLARCAATFAVDFVIVEVNQDTVIAEKSRGTPILYGDATQEAVLARADIAAARVVVVAIPDPAATRRVVETARRLNPAAHVVARTRYSYEVDRLVRMGADAVVPEEFEAAVAIFRTVLRKYLVPRSDVERFVAEVRADSYQVFRRPASGELSLGDLPLRSADAEIRIFRLRQQSELTGHTLSQLDVRKRYDVAVLMVQRDGEVISNPDPDFSFDVDDVVVVMGPRDKIVATSELF